MSDALNAVDAILVATSPRLIVASNAAVILNSSGAVFTITNGVTTPNSIVFSASLIALEGVVTFSSSGCTLSSVSGNTATLLPVDMTSQTATVTASLTYRGTLFSTTVGISKIGSGIQSSLQTQNASSIVGGGATASVTCSVYTNGTLDTGNWYVDGGSSVGTSYWVRFSKIGAASTPTSGTLDTWQALSSNRSIGISKVNSIADGNYKIEISSSSSGSPIVATGSAYLYAASYAGAIP